MPDIIVIGAGIAGASAAFELADQASVLLLEAESQPGYHTTGRSAALFTPHYGPDLIQRINRHSIGFFTNPPDGFAETHLLAHRGMLSLAGQDEDKAAEELAAIATGNPAFRIIDATEALAMAPVVRPECAQFAIYEEAVFDMDVAALHQSYLKGFKRRGGTVTTDARVTSLARTSGGWTVTTPSETHECGIVINAAGAWADEIAAMAGLRKRGLTPKRRTAITIDGPPELDLRRQPMVEFVESGMYMRPESGRLMASPADETPMAPHDVQPDDFDVAMLVDTLSSKTFIRPQRPASSWAGLRSFFPDGLPLAGFDAETTGFFWLAGQGGYGIMMAPTLAKATAGLVLGQRLPDDIIACGVTAEELAPSRLDGAA